jgi:hypothetical protein
MVQPPSQGGFFHQKVLDFYLIIVYNIIIMIGKGDMKSWEELSHKEQLVAMHYDFYKDVHGIRPRWMNYDEMTEEQLEAEMEQLGRESEIQRQEEEKRQRVAIKEFEERVANLMHGSTNRKRVIEWLMQAEDVQGDADYFCYLNDLPYGYLKDVA